MFPCALFKVVGCSCAEKRQGRMNSGNFTLDLPDGRRYLNARKIIPLTLLLVVVIGSSCILNQKDINIKNNFTSASPNSEPSGAFGSTRRCIEKWIGGAINKTKGLHVSPKEIERVVSNTPNGLRN